MYDSLTASLLIGNEYNQNQNHSSLGVVRGSRRLGSEGGGEWVTEATLFTKPLRRMNRSSLVSKGKEM